MNLSTIFAATLSMATAVAIFAPVANDEVDVSTSVAQGMTLYDAGRNPPPDKNWCNCPGTNSTEPTATITYTPALGITYTGVCTNGQCASTIVPGTTPETKTVNIPSGSCINNVYIKQYFTGPTSIACSPSQPCPTLSYPATTWEPLVMFGACLSESDPIDISTTDHQALNLAKQKRVAKPAKVSKK